MLGSSLRRVRRLWSSSSLVNSNNSAILETSNTIRIIHLPSSSASKCFFNNININNNNYYYCCFSTSAVANVTRSLSSKKNVSKDGRRQRRRVIKNNSNGKTNAYAAIELALDSVVKIFTVSSSPNYFLPWQNNSQRETMGSGFVIPGKKILTNAHVVADNTFVFVRKHGSSIKYRARVEAVGHECDLAILVVESEKLWEGMNFLELGDIPFLQQAVAVVGYPQGGDNISVTKGVVSRVEPTQYVPGATRLMAIQIDAAINPATAVVWPSWAIKSQL